MPPEPHQRMRVLSKEFPAQETPNGCHLPGPSGVDGRERTACRAWGDDAPDWRMTMPGNIIVLNNATECYVGDSKIDRVTRLLDKVGYKRPPKPIPPDAQEITDTKTPDGRRCPG